MVPLGTLHHGNEFSLLFPLAECNLNQFLMSKNRTGPLSSRERFHFLNSMSGLTNALAWLHHSMIGERHREIFCLHLDLKPENILVEGAHSPEFRDLRLLISDFGISSIKGRTGTVAPYGTIASRTTNRRSQSTYFAPEVRRRGQGKVGTSGDIWSLGCIYCLCVTFMVGQSKYVRNFEEKRLLDGEDMFYVGEDENVYLKPAVKAWLNTLCKEDKHRDHGIVVGICWLIEKQMLVASEKERATATEVFTQLDYIRKELESVQSEPIELLAQTLHIPLDHTLGNNVPRLPSLASQDFRITQGVIQLEKFKTYIKSILTPDGKYIAYMANKGESILLVPIIVPNILWRHGLFNKPIILSSDRRSYINLLPPNGCHWELMCFSETHLCAVSSGNANSEVPID
jgi:serine/threonine protein kinase